MRAHTLAARLLASENLPVIVSTSSGTPGEALHVEPMTWTYVNHDGIYVDVEALAVTSYRLGKAD